METVLACLEVVGIVAFALSGAMQAIAKKVDLFGVLLLGILTALGGGMLRDITLGALPPRVFTNLHFLALAASVSLAVFLLAFLLQDTYRKNEELIDRINNVFDALGLGAFSVSGATVAMAGGSENGVLIIYAGMITAVGGGMLRDILLREIPFILKKHIYAAAALFGATVYYLLLLGGIHTALSAAVGVTAVFLVRMLATLFHWNFPRAIR